MNTRIASIENTIARDPGRRNIFALLRSDQLRLAALSLRLAKRVGIVSGYYIASAKRGETDGPPGAKVVGDALTALGIEVDYITDEENAPLFRSLGLDPLIEPENYIAQRQPTHLVAIERAGRSADGHYRNMRGDDISSHTCPLDALFIQAEHEGVITIGIGDGGNEIGMGKMFSAAMDRIDHGLEIACAVETDFCIIAGVSNWGAYGLAGALSVLVGRDLLPTADQAARDIETIVRDGGAVDGVTGRAMPTVDGLSLDQSIRMLESIRRQIAPLPNLLQQGDRDSSTIEVGILGYGETGQATAELMLHLGHRVVISDSAVVEIYDADRFADIEVGGHTIGRLAGCCLVIASPGVPADASVRFELHRLGIPVVSALEVAFQLCDRPLIGITGSVGKRSTCLALESLFQLSKKPLTIGGNKGKPFAELLLSESSDDPIALAVSSFQLETVVQFRTHIAVILNLFDHHLDRHRTLEEYARIKSRVFMNHHPDDILILSHDDHRVRALAEKHRGRTMFVSEELPMRRGAWLERGEIFTNLQGTVEHIGSADPAFPENLLAAVLIARLCGIDAQAISTNLDRLMIERRGEWV